MKKRDIVTKNQDFSKIIQNRKYIKNNLYIIYYKENNLNNSRFGISVSKKIGNAVVRNKIKRQMKNIIDKNKNLFKKETDYIIIIKKGILDYDYHQIEANLIDFIKNNNWRWNNEQKQK